MASADLHIVTGAFGFSGRYIARRLLEGGVRVRTLTSRPQSASPFGDRVEAMPFNFDDPARLTEALRGAAVLYNTYWVRFVHGITSFEQAIANSRTLIACAAEAGVRRFVHVSITNPSEDSPLPYFRGKAIVECILAESGLSFAILRPTVLFGRGDVLINNIAWMLRRLPAFGVFGRGDYLVQPVYVDDLAAMAIDCAGRTGNLTIDAVGPEKFTYEQMVRLVRQAVGGLARVIHVSPDHGLLAGKVVGGMVGDVPITREEIEGLMAGLLVSHHPPTCPTPFSLWLARHADELGRQYASELERHYR
ncbi:MAG TPA: NAD-dependent epimerase/dehydratase family protein [Phycisphaerae bacterium]|nr:NAD-dependent epimerase/dehydratase family protein [Phycisphaerae bacterium]